MQNINCFLYKTVLYKNYPFYKFVIIFTQEFRTLDSTVVKVTISSSKINFP